MSPYPSVALPSSTEALPAPPPESLLIRYVRAHIRQGEKSKERAERTAQKSEEHFVAAGQYLITLKTHYAPTWQQWEVLLKTKISLSAGRASELMGIASGRTSQGKIRAADAARKRIARAGHFSSSGVLKKPAPPIWESDVPESPVTSEAGSPITVAGSPAPRNGDANQLIDQLTSSSSTTRADAGRLLIGGSRQTEFASATNAVADLYSILSKAGR